MTNIVPILAGGGTRLPAHIGVLQALKDLHIDFSHLVGVSGGSIIASLYAAGLSIAEIKHIAITKDYNQFKGFSLVCLISNGGLSSGNIFEQWVGQHLAGKRFIDLDRNLSIIATDVKLADPLFLTEREHLI